MPSLAYRRWITSRADALDEIEQAHAAVGGSGRGRRYATQQLNQAYAVLLASQFQGFCRDLHTESVGHLVTALAPSLALLPFVQDELQRGRQLDRGNAQPGSIGTDFNRLGFHFWAAVDSYDPVSPDRRTQLEMLNNWRNAIAHQDFDPARLGGSATLQLAQVRRWRNVCRRLARTFDEVIRRRLLTMTALSPW